MSRPWQTLGLLALLVGGGPALAQLRSEPASSPLPALKSPVDTFRELLVLSPQEREQALAQRPTAKRAAILTKLREYQTLNANDREVRLLATELRWWLLPLLRLPATNRAAQLSVVPLRLRQLVDDRLQSWDILPPDLQQAQLDNEDVAQHFTRLQSSTASQREQILQGLTPERRRLLEAGLARWTAMTADERRATCQQFERYFELTPREQGRVLNQLSDTERDQMKRTLASYANLSRQQRVTCLRSFEKFAGMDAAERQQFLKNAERWEKMSPAERETWRKLVKYVPDLPLLPPDFGPGGPAMPPALPRSAPRPVTNGGG